MKILLASERGFCSGVRHAVELAERLAEEERTPVYVLHELVHNRNVVRSLEEKNIHVVNSPEGLPDGARLVFSAHGISRAGEDAARALPLRITDATCPLVKHVHRLAAREDTAGRTVLLAGKKGHREVEGILGRIPSGRGILLESVADAVSFHPEKDRPYSFLSQTTFLQEDFEKMSRILSEKIADFKCCPTVCRATLRRQEQVRLLAARCACVVVAGSPDSSNSRRLCEAAREEGAESFLADGFAPLPSRLEEIHGDIGLISGASASGEEVRRILDRLLALPGAEYGGEFTL